MKTELEIAKLCSKCKTINDLTWVGGQRENVKQAAIQVFKDILKHQKNPFKAFQTFFDVTDEEIAA